MAVSSSRVGRYRIVCFLVLATVEDEVGVLPSLALDLKEYKDLPEASRNNYVAAVAYQTAYVMGGTPLRLSVAGRRISETEVRQ